MTAAIVAVPARNEQDRLPHLLAGLARQTVASTTKRLRVVVVLNNTDDGSRAVIEAGRHHHPNLDIEFSEVTYPPALAHVGSARRAAMERALQWLDGDDQGVLLTTDADAVPAVDWVERNLAAIATGADLVGGRIFGDAEEEAALGPGFLDRARKIARYGQLCDQLTAQLDPIAHDPWPRHQDHTGASLAVRAAVYRAVGGMPALPFREDLGFVNRVVGAGYRLVHPQDVQVTVSARLKGRAPGGMADCIADWVAADARQAPIMVAAPAATARRANRRAQIRQLLGRPHAQWQSTLEALGADATALAGLQLTQRDIARLIQTLSPDEPDAPADTPIEQAVSELAGRIAQLQSRQDVA